MVQARPTMRAGRPAALEARKKGRSGEWPKSREETPKVGSGLGSMAASATRVICDCSWLAAREARGSLSGSCDDVAHLPQARTDGA
jgi:hypothetical protein